MACFSLCGICDGDSDFARTFLLLTGQGLCVMLTYRNENHKRGSLEDRSSTVPDLGNANGGKQNIRVRLLALSGGRIFVLRKLCLMKHNIQLHSGIL